MTTRSAASELQAKEKTVNDGMLTDDYVESQLKGHGLDAVQVGLSADWIFRCWRVSRSPDDEDWEGLFLFEEESAPELNTFSLVRRREAVDDQRRSNGPRYGDYEDEVIVTGDFKKCLTVAQSLLRS